MPRLTYKYRLYPNKEQSQKLETTLDICRFLYNSALEERKEAYQKRGVSLSYRHQQNELPECKLEVPELNQIHSQVLQDTLRRLDKSFQNFFRRVKNGEKPGYPRFKSKNRFHSFTYPQFGFSLDGNKLNLSKIGDIKIKLHRPINDEIKTLTITREIDKWYACFSVEIDTPPLKPIESAIGIDVGLNSFVTLSTGEEIENPRWFRNTQRRLRRRQKSLSRKKLGSKNRNKQRIRVAKYHKKVSNQRKDFHHEVSRQLVDNYDLIAYEDLNIKGMVRNHHLAKSISDAGWGKFIAFVCYKAEGAGKQAIAVNPYGTTTECSECGFPVPKSLSQRMHNCPNCGLVMPRDWNSAKVILSRTAGTAGYKACGDWASTPMEQVRSMKQEAHAFRRR